MALASTFKIEIENASQSWVDVTDSVVSLSDGTTSEAQIIPTVSISFGRDADNIDQYLTPTVNPTRARIRITEVTTTTYYLMEDVGGTVKDNITLPTVTGRAYAGVIVDFPLATFVPAVDMPMSAVVSQLCVENIADQTGTSIPIIWGATEDPTVPGKRIEFSRTRRLDTIRDLAASCGAGVRVSLDGLSFEVYDIPTKALSDSASFDYSNALTLSYKEERIDKPLNAIRVKGAAFDYSLGRIPVINVWVLPNILPADGTNTATAIAQVIDASGVPVKHSYIIDTAIDADSYTTIPVSGCYDVLAVWLNTGTQSVPVKGDRIDITTFNASTITVPTQSTDLFIVSYTQAEDVSWYIEDYADRVDGEAKDTTGTLGVSVDNALGQVIGVYRDTDTRRVGTNFFAGGSFTENTTSITLGISPGATGTAVIIDYIKYNATPLGATISPSTSLVDSDGVAESTVGAGSTIGAGFIVASALSQQGYAMFSLTGSAVGSLSLTADPSIIRRSIEDETVISSFVAEISEISVSGSDYYILVDNPIYFVSGITVTGYASAKLYNWVNDAPDYKVYIYNATPPATTAATVTYQGYEVVSEEDKQSTLTANVKKTDGTAATNGTSVVFEIIGRATLGCTLSAGSDTTTDGEASVILTAGDQTGTITVRAISGGFHAEVQIVITDEDINGGSTTNTGTSGSFPTLSDNLTPEDTPIVRNDRPGIETCNPVANDSNDDDGSVAGSRRIVGCEGEPLADQEVTLSDGTTVATDKDGYFKFDSGSTGENTISVGGTDYTFDIAPKDSDARDGFRIVCTDSDGNITFEG